MLIGKGCQIMWMHIFHYKSDERPALLWPENTDSRQFGKSLGSVTGELRIVFENRGTPDLFKIINGGGQADRARNIRCAPFKSVGRFLVAAFFQGDCDDH